MLYEFSRKFTGPDFTPLVLVNFTSANTSPFLFTNFQVSVFHRSSGDFTMASA
jgi:hypothetical protein